MESGTNQSIIIDNNEEFNDTLSFDQPIHHSSYSTLEVLTTTENNASMINSRRSTLAQLNIASDGSLNISDGGTAVPGSPTAPKKSSSKRKRKNSGNNENNNKKSKIANKKKKDISDEESSKKIAEIPKQKEKIKKSSDFSFDLVTKRLNDMTNIINKSFLDIKKTVTQIESKHSAELKELRSLVQILIDNWNEFKSMPSSSSSRVLEERTGFPESGFIRRSDNSIHLGEGIYISKKMYNSIASDATSNAVFVKKIIMTQYTPEEIIQHSVKGGKSNKIKMTSRKPGLDPTIRLAVKGIFRYYLSTRYTDEAYIKAEVDKCDDHIRRKISDLRKKARPAKLPKKNDSSSSNENSSGSSSSDSDETESKKSRKSDASSSSDDSDDSSSENYRKNNSQSRTEENSEEDKSLEN